MDAETKNPHNVRSSSADSHHLDHERSNSDTLDKKAPWWSYFWVGSLAKESILHSTETDLTVPAGL